MDTQPRTLSIRLTSANEVKLGFLEKAHKQVESVGRDYLKFKMRQIQSDRNPDYNKERKQKYHEYRKEYPGLNSGILQSTMRWIEQRIQSHIQQCRNHHKLVKWPKINRFPIIIRDQMSNFRKDDRHFDAWFRFCRTNFPLKLCDFHQKVLEKTVDFGDSQVIQKDGEWWLQLVCKIELEKGEDLEGTLGIDLGEVNPIVCDDGKRIGSGSRIKHKQKEFQRKRSSQQSRNEEISSKQRRWMKDRNHKMSRRLVDYATSRGTEVLVLENLKGQHLSNRRYRHYKWSFAELKSFIEYKAEAAGMEVIDVDPAWTSQTCSECGQKSEDNRKTRSLFECSVCGYRADADVNAAKNICALSSTDGPLGV